MNHKSSVERSGLQICTSRFETCVGVLTSYISTYNNELSNSEKSHKPMINPLKKRGTASGDTGQTRLNAGSFRLHKILFIGGFVFYPPRHPITQPH